MSPRPMPDSRGDVLKVEKRRARATKTNTAGTQGYPQTRYGRARSGRRFRSTITEAAVIPYRIQLGKITSVYSSRYRPLSNSTEDHRPSRTILAEGVRYCG